VFTQLSDVLSQEIRETRIKHLVLQLYKPQNSVLYRGLCSNLLGSLSKNYDSKEFETTLLPIVVTLTNDFHSLVRLSIISYFKSIARTIKKEKSNEVLFPLILEFLEDEDSFVRVEAVDQLCEIMDYFDKQKIADEILPMMQAHLD
jgi:hypothetical protein